MTDRFLGMISGTSVDGIDVVLADFAGGECQLLAAETFPYADELRQRVQALIEAEQIRWKQLGSADVAIGRAFADAALSLLEQASIDPASVTAIGHHGQTVYHEPLGEYPFTIQIGDPNIVAAQTGITTIADFRRMDMAYGGQGAPLVCAFHDELLRKPSERRVVLNIGGIANITTLLADAPALGFDTGPGNTLMDAWVQRCRNLPIDESGNWAASGRVDESLLSAMLGDPYFALAAPKSTGREYFNSAWLDAKLAGAQSGIDSADVQATLCELTAATIAQAIATSAPSCNRVIVCGGGAHNDDLMRRLGRRLGNILETSDQYGIAADWIEGLAFAWLARERIAGRAGNVPSVTGARRPAMLGGIYSGGQ